MVKQVICVHTGQAGIRMGAAFWDLMLAEQGLSYEGLPRGPSGSIYRTPTWGQYGDQEGHTGAFKERDSLRPVDESFFSDTESRRRVPRYVSHSIELCLFHSLYASMSAARSISIGFFVFFLLFSPLRIHVSLPFCPFSLSLSPSLFLH